jgi:hypothetical protein
VVQDPSDAAIRELPDNMTIWNPTTSSAYGMPRVETLAEIHRQPCSITRPCGER